MLVYRGVAPRLTIQTQQGPPPAAAAAAATPGTTPLAPPPPQIVDITLYLDDYKPVDGVMLPHHMSRSIDGKPSGGDDVQDHQVQPGLQGRRVRGEVGEDSMKAPIALLLAALLRFGHLARNRRGGRRRCASRSSIRAAA